MSTADKLQLEEAIAFIQGYSSYLVVAHENPDGDAISSCAAMSWLLEQYGKQVTIVNQSELPGRLSSLISTFSLMLLLH